MLLHTLLEIYLSDHLSDTEGGGQGTGTVGGSPTGAGRGAGAGAGAAAGAEAEAGTGAEAGVVPGAEAGAGAGAGAEGGAAGTVGAGVGAGTATGVGAGVVVAGGEGIAAGTFPAPLPPTASQQKGSCAAVVMAERRVRVYAKFRGWSHKALKNRMLGAEPARRGALACFAESTHLPQHHNIAPSQIFINHFKIYLMQGFHFPFFLRTRLIAVNNGACMHGSMQDRRDKALALLHNGWPPHMEEPAYDMDHALVRLEI